MVEESAASELELKGDDAHYRVQGQITKLGLNTIRSGVQGRSQLQGQAVWDWSCEITANQGHNSRSGEVKGPCHGESYVWLVWQQTIRHFAVDNLLQSPHLKQTLSNPEEEKTTNIHSYI